jgi:hypothetical protein
MKFKETGFMEVESRMVIAQAGESSVGEGMGTELQLNRSRKFWCALAQEGDYR